MANYQDDWDRDDYGFNSDQNQSHSIQDFNDIQSSPDDLKAQEDSELSLSNGQNDNDSSIGNQASQQAFIDLTDDQPAFAVSNKIKITNPYISKYQKAIIIGKRAQQISNNSPIYTSGSIDQLKMMNPLQIAQKQFNERKIPFIIRRHLPNGQFEDWKFSQLKF